MNKRTFGFFIVVLNVGNSATQVAVAIEQVLLHFIPAVYS